MLEKIADFYDAEVDAKVKALTSLIEPIMIVFVGGMVGFIVISMYLPIFSLYDKIRQPGPTPGGEGGVPPIYTDRGPLYGSKSLIHPDKKQRRMRCTS